MPRKDDTRAIVDVLERDPRLRALPFSPRMLWFALVRAMQSLSLSVLRFGSVTPSTSEIAMLVGMSESEFEANLPLLIARGLIELESDGALASPLLRGMATRSETNRTNGLKGGAVRRAQAEARRAQLIIPLPISGGKAVLTASTDKEPNASSLPVSVTEPPKLKLDDLESPKKLKLVVSTDEFHRIGRAAFEAAGFDPARSVANYGIVRQWLADGASETQILETIAAAMERGARPQHLGYFSKAIQAAVQRGTEAGGREPTARSMAWEYALEQWRVDNKQGRMPMPQDFAADGTRIAA